MSNAIHAALNLLFRVASSTFDEMGTNALVIGVGFAYTIFKMLRDYQRGGWPEVRKDWAGEAGAGFLFTMGAWMLLFAYTLVATIYQEHQSLVNKSGSLSKQIDTGKETLRAETQRLKDELAESKRQCALHTGENNILQKQNRDQQGTINGCLTQAMKMLTPVAQQTTSILLDMDHQNPNARKLRILVVTNKPIAPSRVMVTCSQGVKNITDASLDVLGGPPRSTRISGRRAKLSNIQWDLQEPDAWTEKNPLLVTMIYEGDAQATCGIRAL